MCVTTQERKERHQVIVVRSLVLNAVPLHILLLPVQRNTAEVKDRCCGEQDIQRGADQAKHLPISPEVLDQLNGTEGHHQHRNQQVGKGKRHNEIVGFYFPVRETA